MPRQTVEQLAALREAQRKTLRARGAGEAGTRILIGMGTCGIAAGAKETQAAFEDEIRKNDLSNVTIQQTGCMGLCYSEPTVEVVVPGLPTVVYGRVNAETARRIVRKHLLGRLLINDHIYDKPAADLVG